MIYKNNLPQPKGVSKMNMSNGNLFITAIKQLIREQEENITLIKVIGRAEKLRKLLDKCPVIGKKIINNIPLTPKEIYRLKQVKI